MKSKMLTNSRIFKALMLGAIAVTAAVQVNAEQILRIDPAEKINPQKKAEAWRKYVVHPESADSQAGKKQSPFICLKPGAIVAGKIQDWKNKIPTVGKENLTMIAVLRLKGAEGHVFLFDYRYRLGVMTKSGKLIPYSMFSYIRKDGSGKTGYRLALPGKNFNLETDKWIHVAAVFDREGDMTLFINGEVVASKPISEYKEQDTFSHCQGSYLPFDFRSMVNKTNESKGLTLDIAYAELRNDLLSLYKIKKDFEKHFKKHNP